MQNIYPLESPARAFPVAPSAPVILGVASSDAHVVANILIEKRLLRHGYHVVNLGACTPTIEFMEAYSRHPDALAIAIGSMNGHAREDLDDLLHLKLRYDVRCPILLGGNLAIGGHRCKEIEGSFKDLGVSMILDSADDLMEVLARLRRQRKAVSLLAPVGG